LFVIGFCFSPRLHGGSLNVALLFGLMMFVATALFFFLSSSVAAWDDCRGRIEIRKQRVVVRQADIAMNPKAPWYERDVVLLINGVFLRGRPVRMVETGPLRKG